MLPVDLPYRGQYSGPVEPRLPHPTKNVYFAFIPIDLRPSLDLQNAVLDGDAHSVPLSTIPIVEYVFAHLPVVPGTNLRTYVKTCSSRVNYV